jgi:hypothetical protein
LSAVAVVEAETVEVVAGLAISWRFLVIFPPEATL